MNGVDAHVKRRGHYIATPSNTVDSAINCQTPAGSNVCPALCASRQGKAKSALLRLTGNCQRLASTLYRLADALLDLSINYRRGKYIAGPSNTVDSAINCQTPAGSNVCPALCASRQVKAKSALLKLTGNCQRLASTLYRLADALLALAINYRRGKYIAGPLHNVDKYLNAAARFIRGIQWAYT